jgi:hypothetical protein
VGKELGVGDANGMGGTGGSPQRRPLGPEFIFCGRSGPGGLPEWSATQRREILYIEKRELPVSTIPSSPITGIMYNKSSSNQKG